jgi:hypothetical protein
VLSASEIRDLLAALDAELAKSSIRAEVYLLGGAMRLGAEFHDEADVRFLLRYLNLTRLEAVEQLLARYYPLDRFPPKTFFARRDARLITVSRSQSLLVVRLE